MIKRSVPSQHGCNTKALLGSLYYPVLLSHRRSCWMSHDAFTNSTARVSDKIENLNNLQSHYRKKDKPLSVDELLLSGIFSSVSETKCTMAIIMIAFDFEWHNSLEIFHESWCSKFFLRISRSNRVNKVSEFCFSFMLCNLLSDLMTAFLFPCVGEPFYFSSKWGINGNRGRTLWLQMWWLFF